MKSCRLPSPSAVCGIALAALAALVAAPVASASAAPDGPARPGALAESAAPPAPPVAAGPAYRFALAKALAAEGDVVEAARELAEVVRQVPDDPYVRLEYAAVLSDLASDAPTRREADERQAEARRQAEAALALDPENLEAWRAVAQARLELAEEDRSAIPGAVEALEKVHQGDPADYRTAMLLGQIHLESGQAHRAVEVLERLAAEVPAHAQLDRLLVRAYLGAGRHPEAEEVLARLVAADPLRADHRLDLARLAGERGDHEAALALLRQAPPEVAELPALRRELALELVELGRHDEALEALAGLDGAASAGLRALIYAAAGRHADFAAALAALEPDLALHAELAARLEQAGAGPQAIEVWSTLLSRLEAGEEPSGEVAARLPLPAEVLVRDDLAQLEARLGRPADAAATLEPLLGHSEPAVAQGSRLRAAGFLFDAGESERAQALLAGGEDGVEVDLMTLDALFEGGDEPAATRLFRRLAQSDEPRTVLRAAGVAQSHERHDLALPLLEALVEGDPAPEALYQLGAAYERSGRIEEAVGALRRALDAAPELDEAANYLGYLWADRGENLDEALELIRRAVAAEPDNAAYLDSLGWVHHRLGDDELALGYLQRAAHLLPDDPEVLEHLGDVQRAVGDDAGARESYQRALAAGGAEDVEGLRRKVAELTRGGAASE